jgi:hypothetical protein
VEIGTHLKTVKITLNIFAVHLDLLSTMTIDYLKTLDPICSYLAIRKYLKVIKIQILTSLDKEDIKFLSIN